MWWRDSNVSNALANVLMDAFSWVLSGFSDNILNIYQYSWISFIEYYKAIYVGLEWNKLFSDKSMHLKMCTPTNLRLSLMVQSWKQWYPKVSITEMNPGECMFLWFSTLLCNTTTVIMPRDQDSNKMPSEIWTPGHLNCCRSWQCSIWRSWRTFGQVLTLKGVKYPNLAPKMLNFWVNFIISFLSLYKSKFGSWFLFLQSMLFILICISYK